MRKAVVALKSVDPVLGDVIDRVGPYRIRYLEPNFETLVKSIVYQQLSGKVASTIFGRLQQAAGDGCLTPEAALRLTPAQMRSVGLSRQKIDYIRDIASRTPRFDSMRRMPDDEVIRELTGLKGVGVWTAHMFLMFALRRQDVLPSGDLGLRAAVKRAYGLAELPKPSEVDQLGEKWRPHRTVATWYLWRSQEPNANL
jgi:DNA-3-methyladenine glycosylase II